MRAPRSDHISPWLTGLPEEASNSHPFYFSAEDAGPGRFEVIAGAHVCNESASVRYATEAETASPTADFDPTAGTADFTIVHVTDPWRVDVPIHEDGLVEPPLESFRVGLSHPGNGSLRDPSGAPFYLIDVDGSDRATLDHEPYMAKEFEEVVRIAVFRAGPATGTLSVPFLVEPSGAIPATPAEDYSVLSGSPLSFGAGERVEVIEIAVTNDGVEEADETLKVSLTQAPPDSVTETTVTIDGEVDVSAPRSRFHHPRDGWRYSPDDYRIREIHVFTGDAGDSGVVRLKLALRRNSKNGSCAWWDVGGLRAGRLRRAAMAPHAGVRTGLLLLLLDRSAGLERGHEDRELHGLRARGGCRGEPRGGTRRRQEPQHVRGEAGIGSSERLRDSGPRTRRISSTLLVICLTLALSLAMSGVGLAARVRVRASTSDRWRPAHLFITEGDTVIWKNPDSRRHNVVAYGGGWQFNRMLLTGETARRVFDEVRSGGDPYAYRCTLHSAIVDGGCEGMCGLVHVFTS